MQAPWTVVRDTPNKSVRQKVDRRGVVLHHAAMTSLDGLRRLCMGGKQVSATAICKDNQLELLVPDGYRPWSLSSAYWDSALRSVETANESVNGWTISDASHWSLARAVAFWAHTDGFYPHRDGDPRTWTVLGHREVYGIHRASYATACPGGLDLGLVTRRAQQLLNGTAQAGMNTRPVVEEEEDMPTYELVQAKNGGTVWFVVDRIHRYGIPDEEALKDYQFFIRSKGQSDKIIQTNNVTKSFGTPVYAGGAPVHPAITVPRVDLDYKALAGEVAKHLPSKITGTIHA